MLLSILALLLSAQAAAKPGFPVLGYLPMYASTGPYGDSINLNDSAKFPWDRLTHVMEAFAQVNGSGVLSFPIPQRANLVLKAHQNNTRCLLSIGGAGSNNAAWSSAVSAANRTNFVNNLVAACNTYGYDGIDIDWEFPGPSDKANFTAFMTQLSTALRATNSSCGGCAFDGQPRQLTFFVSPGNDICGVDWNDTGLQNAVDFAVYGAYDFNAPPGYNSPTSMAWGQTDCRGVSYNFCLTQTTRVLTQGVPPNYAWPKSKMVISLPLYDKQNYATFSSGTPVLVALKQGSYLGMDTPQDEARYSVGGSTHYVNNDTAYCRKMSWAISQGFGGFALWEITHAYPANDAAVSSLWNTIGGVAACVNVPTPTPAPTPNLLPGGLIDIGSSGNATNNWAGTWGFYAGTGGSSIAMSYTAPGNSASSYHASGPYAIQGSGAVGTNAPSMSTSLAPAAAPQNLDSQGYTRVDFWFKASVGQYRIAFDRTTTRATGNDHYGIDFDVTDTNWNYYSFYLANATQPSWATPDAKAFNDVIAIVFQPYSGPYTMAVDDLELVKQVVTATPTPPAYLVDTVEDGNSTNSWGGGWENYAPAPSTAAQSFSAAGFPFSAYGNQKSARLYGSNSSTGTLSTFTTWLSNLNAGTTVDISAYNYLNFYFKGNGVQTQYTVGLARASGENWVFNFTMPATTEWVRIEAPLIQSAWSYSWGGTANSWGLGNARRLYWYTREAGSFDFSIDDIYFENRPPTPTPSRTPSFTLTPTPTQSPTLSFTATYSFSHTATPSATPTGTPSASPSASPSGTPSATPPDTFTRTATPSVTESHTPPPAGSTDTFTPTVTESHTNTPPPTATPSATSSGTPSLTSTPSVTPPATPSGTASVTPTGSPSDTPIPGATSTGTSTPAPPTATITATSTPVPATATATGTPTPPPSATATPSATAVPPGSSSTPTPTQSPVQSATGTPAPGGPATATRTPAPGSGVSTNGTLQVLDGRAFPNPSPRSIRVLLDGPADEVTLRFYTVNLQLVEVLKQPVNTGGGWVGVDLPQALRDKFGAGTFHYTADASRGGTQALKPWVGTFVFLR